MKKIRLGIIGIGKMGGEYVRMLSEGAVEEIELTAVCDIDEEKLQKAYEKTGGTVRTFTDWHELLASGGTDAVMVVTPHYLHPPIAMEAFRIGQHVLSDKPTGVYTKQVRELNRVAKESGKVFSTMFCLRTMPVYQKIREMVQGGELGQIKRLCWINTDWYRPQAYHDSSSWRSSWQGEGGGLLLNQCPHNLDLWQWMFGMPKSVTAHISFGRYYDIEVDDDVTAYFSYENGINGTYIASTGEAPGTNRLEIMGDMGRLVYENDKLIFDKNAVSEREFNKTNDKLMAKPEKTRIEIPFEPEQPIHCNVLRNFAAAILRGEALICPGEEGIKELTISNAMYLSAWTARTIELPLDEELFYNMLNEKAGGNLGEK